MKYTSFILVALMAFGSIITASAQFQRTPTPNDTLQSVRRQADGSVVFSIYAPKARTVSVAGDVVPWGAQPEVKENPNGVWNITVKDVKVYELN